jgi:hypothetical protein
MKKGIDDKKLYSGMIKQIGSGVLAGSKPATKRPESAAGTSSKQKGSPYERASNGGIDHLLQENNEKASHRARDTNRSMKEGEGDENQMISYEELLTLLYGKIVEIFQKSAEYGRHNVHLAKSHRD